MSLVKAPKSQMDQKVALAILVKVRASRKTRFSGKRRSATHAMVMVP